MKHKVGTISLGILLTLLAIQIVDAHARGTLPRSANPGSVSQAMGRVTSNTLPNVHDTCHGVGKLEAKVSAHIADLFFPGAGTGLSLAHEAGCLLSEITGQKLPR